MAAKIKIGIVGCGTIGEEMLRATIKHLGGSVKVVSIFDIDTEKMGRFEKIAGKKMAARLMEETVSKSDLVVEAASGQAASEVLDLAVRKNKDVMVMSVGGLLNKRDLIKKAARKGIGVYVPSGALAGIDALKAASTSKITSVTLTTRKPPRGLEGAPYIIKKRIDLHSIKKDTLIFEGNAIEAVKGFPKNINVSALLSLAGIGPRKTRIRIIASPGQRRNIHQVEIKGDFGVIRTETVNVPSPVNPRTSSLAVLSAIATLKNIATSFKIGT